MDFNSLHDLARKITEDRPDASIALEVENALRGMEPMDAQEFRYLERSILRLRLVRAVHGTERFDEYAQFLSERFPRQHVDLVSAWRVRSREPSAISMDARVNLARSLSLMGFDDEAITLAKEIETTPGVSSGQLCVAGAIHRRCAYRSSGAAAWRFYQEAIRVTNRALAMNPSNQMAKGLRFGLSRDKFEQTQ